MPKREGAAHPHCTDRGGGYIHHSTVHAYCSFDPLHIFTTSMYCMYVRYVCASIRNLHVKSAVRSHEDGCLGKPPVSAPVRPCEKVGSCCFHLPFSFSRSLAFSLSHLALNLRFFIFGAFNSVSTAANLDIMSLIANDHACPISDPLTPPLGMAHLWNSQDLAHGYK